MLKTLSKGVNSLDQAILEPYNNISKNLEKNGKDPAAVSFIVGTTSLIFTGFSYNVFGSGARLIGYAMIPDRLLNILDSLKFPPMGTGIRDTCRKINYNIRPSFFLGSAAMMGKGGYEAMQYFMNKEPSLENAVEASLVGIGLFLRASSMYLKDDSYKNNLSNF